jgi:hypothetical protein
MAVYIAVITVIVLISSLVYVYFFRRKRKEKGMKTKKRDSYGNIISDNLDQYKEMETTSIDREGRERDKVIVNKADQVVRHDITIKKDR